MPLCLVQIYLPREQKRPFSEQDIELEFKSIFDEETQEKDLL